ncbi:hypothetical protein PybrP1_006764 [[Pythium] brassicae (nom. inval.)]|nr:hypothetical protein PybrP1_006764 [[Pythium] brassicae (nom. inval.)]
MAFPNGDLEEAVRMEAPSDVEAGDGMVCELDKALYGLKQVAQVWNKTIRNKLRATGFQQSTADKCIYVKSTGSEHAYLYLYVDDPIITGPTDTEIETVAAALAAEFKMKAIGELLFFLGICVRYIPTSPRLHLVQGRYIKEVVAHFNQSDAKPV